MRYEGRRQQFTESHLAADNLWRFLRVSDGSDRNAPVGHGTPEVSAGMRVPQK